MLAGFVLTDIQSYSYRVILIYDYLEDGAIEKVEVPTGAF